MAEITSSDFAKLVEAQKETTRQLMTAEERAADDAKKAEQFRIRSEAATRGHETRLANQNEKAASENADEMQNQQEESTGFLGKIANFMGMDRLRGAAEAEDAAKAKKSDEKTNTFLGKIAGGISDLGKSTKEKIKSGASSIMGMLKKFAFGAFAVAVLAFLQSPYFDKFLKVLREQIIPALATLIDDYLIPIGKVIWEGIVKTWENIKVLFDGLKESFRLFGEGKWWEGIKTFFGSIGTFLAVQLDTAITTLYNAIAKIFGFEETDSVGGKLKQFFTDIYNRVVSFFTETVPAYIDGIIFDLESMVDQVVGFGTDIWNEVKNLFGDFSVFKFVEETFGELFSSIKAIFSGDFSLENFTKLFGSIFDIVYYPINLAVNTIKDIFNLGDPNQPFRLSTFIGDAISKVINFFKGLLDFDIKSLVMQLPGADKVMGVLGKVGSLFGIGDEKDVVKTTTPTGKLDTSKMLTREEFFKQQGIEDPDEYIEYREKFHAQKQARMPIINQTGASNRQKMIARRVETATAAPAPSIVNAPTNVSAPATTNVTQMSKTLAPKDRVMDELGFAV